MKKEELKEWIFKINDDSKSVTKNAKRIVIDECVPFIEKWYNIVTKYGGGVISEDDEYRNNRGEIDDVSFNAFKSELTFHYSDGCRGEYIEDFITVKLNDLLDENFFKKEELRVWKRAVAFTEKTLAEYKEKVMRIEETLADLKANKPKVKTE